MAHCTKCGAQVDAGAAFCQVCGQTTAGSARGGAAGPATPAGAVAAPGARSGLSENAAAALSYALGWLTGIIFLLIDKRPFVQFHAAQSLVVFLALGLLRGVLGVAFGMGFAFGGWRDWDDWGLWGPRGWGAAGAMFGLLRLVGFVLWIVLMVKAYQGERFRVPVAADLAESIAGKPTVAQ